MSTVDAWIAEYHRRGIPSSFRQEPSGTVRYFVEFLQQHEILSGHALDLGAGKGRNSFFLAEKGFQVDAIEYVPSNVSFINEHAQETQLPVHALCQSVTDLWPFESSSRDLAIDIFCYKHQTDKTLQKRYRQELSRVLKPQGIFLISLASDEDGYYGRLLVNSPDPGNKVVIDPVADVQSILYSRADLEKEFSNEFQILDFQEKRQMGEMHEKEYLRVTFLCIMQKRLI